MSERSVAIPSECDEVNEASNGPQSPQASASTNSAIRAVSSFTDEECPETVVVSSGRGGSGYDTREDFSWRNRSGNSGCTDSIRSGVYFIGNHDGTKVKIGKSKNVAHRFKDLARMNGSPITLLADVRGYTAVEKALHKKFHKHRENGEWFTMTTELADLIERAKVSRDIPITLCPRALKEDERPEPQYNEELHLDRDPVGGEADILARWKRAGGLTLAEPVVVEWITLGLWSRHRLDGNGAWRYPTGSLFHCTYVGITRCASQLVDIDDPDERLLAFIYAAYGDANGRYELHGKYVTCLHGKLERRVDIGQARHYLPSDIHHCKTCSRWSNMSASSSGEWLERLAHLTVLPTGLHLARIVNQPDLY